MAKTKSRPIQFIKADSVGDKPSDSHEIFSPSKQFWPIKKKNPFSIALIYLIILAINLPYISMAQESEYKPIDFEGTVEFVDGESAKFYMLWSTSQGAEIPITQELVHMKENPFSLETIHLAVVDEIVFLEFDTYEQELMERHKLTNVRKAHIVFNDGRNSRTAFLRTMLWEWRNFKEGGSVGDNEVNRLLINYNNSSARRKTKLFEDTQPQDFSGQITLQDGSSKDYYWLRNNSAGNKMKYSRDINVGNFSKYIFFHAVSRVNLCELSASESAALKEAAVPWYNRDSAKRATVWFSDSSVYRNIYVDAGNWIWMGPNEGGSFSHNKIEGFTISFKKSQINRPQKLFYYAKPNPEDYNGEITFFDGKTVRYNWLKSKQCWGGDVAIAEEPFELVKGKRCENWIPLFLISRIEFVIWGDNQGTHQFERNSSAQYIRKANVTLHDGFVHQNIFMDTHNWQWQGEGKEGDFSNREIVSVTVRFSDWSDKVQTFPHPQEKHLEIALTAKEGLHAAALVARNWQSNASLYAISSGAQTTFVDDKGFPRIVTTSWLYEFRIGNKCLIVESKINALTDSSIAFPSSVECESSDFHNGSIVGWNVDSDKALRFAILILTLTGESRDVSDGRMFLRLRDVDENPIPLWSLFLGVQRIDITADSLGIAIPLSRDSTVWTRD